MKIPNGEVYIVFRGVSYEGSDFQGVFAKATLARKRCNELCDEEKRLYKQLDTKYRQQYCRPEGDMIFGVQLTKENGDIITFYVSKTKIET